MKDITGKKYGRLTAVKIFHKNSQGNYWLCRCDCGNYKKVRIGHLTTGGTKSCGCLKVENLKKIGGSNKKEFGESSFNKLYKRYKDRAKKKNFDFFLTKDQFKSLTKLDCYYCGIQPHQVEKSSDCYGEYVYSGIDRKVNSLGYTLENSVPCCNECNISKSTKSEKEFQSYVKRLYEHFAARES